MRRQSSRSYANIVRANALTIPNVILVVFAIMTLVFDSWRDALFLGIVVANIAIGSFQEIRSKRELDRLAALVAPKAVVVRDGNEVRVPVEDVVVGDAVRVAAGDQIVADGTLVSADGSPSVSPTSPASRSSYCATREIRCVRRRSSSKAPGCSRPTRLARRVAPRS